MTILGAGRDPETTRWGRLATRPRLRTLAGRESARPGRKAEFPLPVHNLQYYSSIETNLVRHGMYKRRKTGAAPIRNFAHVCPSAQLPGKVPAQFEAQGCAFVAKAKRSRRGSLSNQNLERSLYFLLFIMQLTLFSRIIVS